MRGYSGECRCDFKCERSLVHPFSCSECIGTSFTSITLTTALASPSVEVQANQSCSYFAHCDYRDTIAQDSARLRTQLHDAESRSSVLLEMLGERDEELDELKAELEDVKVRVIRLQLRIRAVSDSTL